MAGQLFTSSTLDKDGRQLVLADNILDVHYYTSETESWDKQGSANQSWFLENLRPTDTFNISQVLTDRWEVFDTAELSPGSLSQNGLLNLGVEKDEGTIGLTSKNKWKLSGDFDIRLYIDWGSYYNEYRSVTHSFLKVCFDNENAARIAFTFDGSGFVFSSEKTVDRDLVFFDWKDNGSLFSVNKIEDAQKYKYLRITRDSGIVRTYISTGTLDTQVGDTLIDSIFSNTLYVEIGLETKEFNTYRHSFSKITVAGDITPSTTFFSTNRGKKQDFPERAIIVVDAFSISIIDEDNSTLWWRLVFDEGGPVPNSDTRVFGCNGSLYCTTSDGLVVFDFHQDRIFKYKDRTVFLAEEPIAERNSNVSFNSYLSDIGDMQDSNIHSVTCRTLDQKDYVAFTHDLGITVVRALTSGVDFSNEGPLPGDKINISEEGGLYWSGYDGINNDGELSFFSNVKALAATGTNQFFRTGFYGVNTPFNLFGSNITSFDVRSVGTDQIAVGTTEGITFLGFSPGASPTGSFSYGVESPAINPISDPSFENYLGIDWKTFYTGTQVGFLVERSTSFIGDGTNSLRLRFNDLKTGARYFAGVTGGVYQDIDFTGLSILYFDIKIDGSAAAPVWAFEIEVDGAVLKFFTNQDGPFTKFTESVDVSSVSGVKRMKLQLRIIDDQSFISLVADKEVFIDNFRTKIGDPDFRVLPAGNASIKEVLLQYDTAGHKTYFSTNGGYGAIDLDDNSLDYFIPIQTFVSGTSDILSADFSRISDAG